MPKKIGTRNSPGAEYLAAWIRPGYGK
jgi:hypothetical protein